MFMRLKTWAKRYAEVLLLSSGHADAGVDVNELERLIINMKPDLGRAAVGPGFVVPDKHTAFEALIAIETAHLI